MKRRDDWEQYLALYLEAQSEKVFVWGETDCVLFAAGAVDAMCGTDIASEHKGKYNDALSAALYLREGGWATVAGALASALPQAKEANYAQRGDIVVMQNRLGVCVGEYSYFMGDVGSQGGMFPVPTAQCDSARSV